MKKSNLPSETTMYSIHPVTHQVITHHLPWPRTSPQLERYVARGFMFERPQVELQPHVRAVVIEPTKPVEPTCPICGRVCKSDFGLRVHMRSHKKEGQ